MADEAFALSPINASAALPTDTDYDAICDAFMETSRGRWFLGEYAKRNRNADTQMVLQAVARIEENIARQKLEEAAAQQAASEPPVDIFPAIHAAMLEARQQIADGFVTDDDRPALDLIKSGMDTIRNVAWALRERGVDLQICGIFDHQVSLMMDGYLQLVAAQTARNAAPDQVLAAFDGMLQRVSNIAAGEPTAFAQEPVETVPVETGPVEAAPTETEPAARVQDVDLPVPPEQPADDALSAPADEMKIVAAAAIEPSVDADTAFREIYGDNHDIEIIESPVNEPAAVAADIDESEDDDFIQAITDTAQELARLETLDTVVATSQTAFAETSAHVDSQLPPEPEIEPELIPEPVRAQAIEPAPVVSARVMPEQTPVLTATPLPDVIMASTQAAPPEIASGNSLGHAVLRSGLVRPAGTRTDPMAVFNRMSQAEKIALMT